ncbi:chemokine (C-X-C motif) ligand 11, duplicate 8 isoform X2 [Puntigrus tetrazona]|uniref:chemokine (C-X-C motif) ligand 11, duplicate 8 isoform X2 n=1 Tax=Puntigrus tetrazona TaxID=1606681 RepID=UPI001C8AB5AA|nr:chemokine (C-X-C motif) ligand 11, duplicate 8 isoform X2 [Puntigrus tetrazona]
MKTAAAFIFLVCCIVLEVKGYTLPGKRRCLCADKGVNKISPKAIQKVKIIPPSPSCKRLEILVTLKRGAGQKCLNPGSEIAKYLLKAIQEKNKSP